MAARPFATPLTVSRGDTWAECQARSSCAGHCPQCPRAWTFRQDNTPWWHRSNLWVNKCHPTFTHVSVSYPSGSTSYAQSRTCQRQSASTLGRRSNIPPWVPLWWSETVADRQWKVKCLIHGVSTLPLANGGSRGRDDCWTGATYKFQLEPNSTSIQVRALFSTVFCWLKLFNF